MNRKGFLLAEETLKIILAVIAIGFLAYFLVSLYMSNQNSKNLELAEESLTHLVAEINSEKTEVEIYNPKGWYITSWEEELPLSCSNVDFDSCLCICDGNDVEDCDDKGTCLESDFSIEDVEIKNPPVTLMIDQVNKQISKK